MLLVVNKIAADTSSWKEPESTSIFLHVTPSESSSLEEVVARRRCSIGAMVGRKLNIIYNIVNKCLLTLTLSDHLLAISLKS